jgi:hypothetical protein
MPAIRNFVFCAAFALAVPASCAKPECKNSDPIFDKYLPDSKAYNDELLRRMRSVDESRLSYWVDGYSESAKTKSLRVKVRGKNLCALMILQITASQKGIEGIVKNRGGGYSDAELTGLEYGIALDGDTPKFIFRKAGRIID